MSSTKMFQGMESGSKPSSRVLAPPGGGSSNIFGTPDSAPVATTTKREVAPPKPAVQQPPPQTQADRTVRGAPKQAFNPITGEPYYTPAKVEEKAKDETTEEKENEQKAAENVKPVEPAEAAKPSTRVAQPPGGKSSGLW